MSYLFESKINNCIMRKHVLTILLSFICLIQLSAQQTLSAKQLIDTLTSVDFWGRGYTRNGNKKAADFICNYFKKEGLISLAGNEFRQSLSYPVNTFPGNMELTLNGIQLKPGIDFIVSPDCKGIKTKGKLEQKDSVTYVDIDHKVIITLKDKLTFSVATDVTYHTAIEILKTSVTANPIYYKTSIENKLLNNFKTANICAMVKGTQKPDSFLVVTAHYDHLGSMGKDTYFPGANDNASGTTLMLGLADYFVKHPQPYSIAFISFTGEEAGLIGSKYFAEHPLIPLSNIRFLFNLDLEGTGIEGATVVNASIYPNEFKILKSINDQFKLLPQLGVRGKAANSDHYWFTEYGVPSFFMYTQGGIKAYHDVYDIAATLPMDHYYELLKLLTGFLEEIQ